MKICIIARNINDDYTGSFEFDQAIALKEAGHDIYVLSLDFRSVRKKRKIGIYLQEYKGIKIVRCSIPLGPLKGKVGDKMYSVFVKRAYRKLVEEAGTFDIIHTHFITISYIGITSLKHLMSVKTRIVVTEHSSTVNCDIDSMPVDLAEKAAYVYKKADRVIAVSDTLAERIHRNFNVRCDVVYNVYDEDIFKYKEKSSFENRPFRFVSVGNLNPNKRMDFLIKSFCKAFNKEEAELYIFGDGAEKQNLKSIIDSEGRAESIFLMGHVSRKEIADFYKNADAFILLSEKETFGVSYVEAMASGMPVISAHSGGPEGFVNSECGIISGDSEEEVASDMRKMMLNINSYDRKQISDYAGLICGSKTVAEKLTRIYSDIIAQKN